MVVKIAGDIFSRLIVQKRTASGNGSHA